MTEFVCRRTGHAYEVGEQLDRNGHAVVHAVASAGSDLALKHYLPATLQGRPDLEARIKAMIANPPAYRRDRSGPVICAWPEDAAYVSGRFAGFVMPRVPTREAVTVQSVASRPTSTWRDRVAVAEDLARAVTVLHDGEVVIGDFREWNLLTWSDRRVTLLGCDRMQVVDPDSGRRFPCVAGRDACTPPELQLAAALSNPFRAGSSDIFTLALHLHLLLLDGAHPFRGRWSGGGDCPPEPLLAQKGLWTYAGDRRLGPCPDAPPLSVLPATLQQYFRAAFVDGARDPEVRPPAHAWLTELVRLRDADSTPPASIPRQVPPSHPAAAAVVRTAAATLPARHDLAIDPGVARSPAVPPARSKPEPTTGTRHLEGAPSRRHRSKLRLAAWAAAALVAIGGVLGVSTVARRSAPPTADPAASAETRPTPIPTPSPTDIRMAALEQIRAQDAPAVQALAESWVAQLSARPAGPPSADQAAVLAGHQQLRKQHPGAVLLMSTDWNYEGRFWVTVMDKQFSTAQEANTWCDTHRFAPPDCFAKKLSHSGAVEGSARYRG